MKIKNGRELGMQKHPFMQKLKGCNCGLNFLKLSKLPAPQA